MGNNNTTNQPSLDSYMSSQQFRNQQQNVYTGNTHIPAYPGGHLDNEDTTEKKIVSMQTQKAMAIKSDFMIDKGSVKLVPTGAAGVYYLSFKFSSQTDVEITIFYLGQDLSDNEDNTQYIQVDTNKYPPIKSYIFGTVKDQEFPAQASVIDTKVYLKDDLTKIKAATYPLIIKMETKLEIQNRPKQRLYTYYAFKFNGSRYETKFIKQKLEVADQAFILDDIFGIANSELNTNVSLEGKDCPICLTNKVDTVVLPCKHMCLCLECATDLRERNNQKCPMCRAEVENYLILKKS